MRWDRPSDLSWWEKAMWVLRDETTNQYWAEARHWRRERAGR